MIISGTNYTNQVSHHKTSNLGPAAQASPAPTGTINAIAGSAASNYDDSQPGSRNFATMVHSFADNFGGLF